MGSFLFRRSLGESATQLWRKVESGSGGKILSERRNGFLEAEGEESQGCLFLKRHEICCWFSRH
jgi:hypothetical protein